MKKYLQQFANCNIVLHKLVFVLATIFLPFFCPVILANAWNKFLHSAAKNKLKIMSNNLLKQLMHSTLNGTLNNSNKIKTDTYIS